LSNFLSAFIFEEPHTRRTPQKRKPEHQIKTSHMSPKFLYYSLLFPTLFLGCNIRSIRWSPMAY